MAQHHEGLASDCGTLPGWVRRIRVLVSSAAVILCGTLGKLFPFSDRMRRVSSDFLCGPILKPWDRLARGVSKEENPDKPEQLGKAG